MAPWSKPTVNSITRSGQQNSPQSPWTPASAGTDPVTDNSRKDGIVTIPKRLTNPNVGDSRLLVHRRCIYERRLPGNAYITAHIERLQHGYIRSPSLTEEELDNVDFVSINFNFHPSHALYHRFKSAIIKLSVHDFSDEFYRTDMVDKEKLKQRLPPSRRSSLRKRPGEGYGNEGDGDFFDPQPSHTSHHHHHHHTRRPRFITYAPHLIYGAVSPETLSWTFSLAGTLGVSEAPVSASLNPSGSMKEQYQLYQMMKIQGSSRTLRSPFGPEHDVEDGEIVWSLEENDLQRSGLPREFSFPILMAKAHRESNVRLHLEIEPVINTWFGTYPSWWLNLANYQPFPKPPTTLRHEFGQKFMPVDEDKGFNFANLTGTFDSYVNMPGSTYNSNISPDGIPLNDGSNNKSGGNDMSDARGNPYNSLYSRKTVTSKTTTTRLSPRRNPGDDNDLIPTKQAATQIINGNIDYEQNHATGRSTAPAAQPPPPDAQLSFKTDGNENNNTQTLNVRVTLEHNLSSAAVTAAAAAAMFYNHPNYVLNNVNLTDPHSGMRSPGKRPASPFLMAAKPTTAMSTSLFQSQLDPVETLSHTHAEPTPYSTSLPYRYQPKNRNYPTSGEAGTRTTPTADLSNAMTLNNHQSTPNRARSLRRSRSREDLSSIHTNSGGKQQKNRTSSIGTDIAYNSHKSNIKAIPMNQTNGRRIITKEENVGGEDLVQSGSNNKNNDSNTGIRTRPQSRPRPVSGHFNNRYSYIEGEEDMLDIEGDTLAAIPSSAAGSIQSGSRSGSGSGSPLTANIVSGNPVNDNFTALPPPPPAPAPPQTMNNRTNNNSNNNSHTSGGTGPVTGGRGDVSRAQSLSVFSAAYVPGGGRLARTTGMRAVSNQSLGDMGYNDVHTNTLLKGKGNDRDRDQKRYSYHFEEVDQF